MQVSYAAAAATATAASPLTTATGTGGVVVEGGASPPNRPGSPTSVGSEGGHLARSSTAIGQGLELSPEVEVAVLVAGGALDSREKSFLLLGLEKKPLLKMFVFLNAGEVLRAAQVCRLMFRKVRG